MKSWHTRCIFTKTCFLRCNLMTESISFHGNMWECTLNTWHITIYGLWFHGRYIIKKKSSHIHSTRCQASLEIVCMLYTFIGWPNVTVEFGENTKRMNISTKSNEFMLKTRSKLKSIFRLIAALKRNNAEKFCFLFLCISNDVHYIHVNIITHLHKI